MPRRSSKGRGDVPHSTSPLPSVDGRVDKSYLLKRIMPNLCDVCQIGIGKSMQFLDGVWQQYQHVHSKVHKFRFKEKTYNLCGDCLEKVERVDNPSKLFKRKYKQR